MLAPEEVRQVLREDENSGYSALEEELSENTDLLNFSEDRWITVHPNGKDHEGRPLWIEEGETVKQAIQRRFGSVEKSKNQNTENNTNKTQPSSAYKNLSDFENKNHKLNYETGAVFDENGNIIIEFSGQEHEIFVSDEDMKKLEGKIFTHNHPNGSPISKDDIIAGFINGKLKELRATTPQGITYSLKPNKNNTVELTKKMVAEFQQVSMSAVRQYKEKSIREIKMGLLSLDDYNKNPYNNFQPYLFQKLDNFFEEHADKYGFDYKKE